MEVLTMDIRREVTSGYTTEGNATVTVKQNDIKGIEIEYSDVSGLIPQYIKTRRVKIEGFVKDTCAKYDVQDAYFIIEDCASYDFSMKHFIDDALQKAIA